MGVNLQVFEKRRLLTTWRRFEPHMLVWRDAVRDGGAKGGPISLVELKEVPTPGRHWRVSALSSSAFWLRLSRPHCTDERSEARRVTELDQVQGDLTTPDAPCLGHPSVQGPTREEACKDHWSQQEVHLQGWGLSLMAL